MESGLNSAQPAQLCEALNELLPPQDHSHDTVQLPSFIAAQGASDRNVMQSVINSAYINFVWKLPKPSEYCVQAIPAFDNFIRDSHLVSEDAPVDDVEHR